jgi:hypothetical protein
MIKILTVPFSKKDETFFEDEVNQFLLNKKIRATKAEFFNYKDNFYWTIFVDYDPFIAEDNKSEKPAIKLNEKDELLLIKLICQVNTGIFSSGTQRKERYRRPVSGTGWCIMR